MPQLFRFVLEALVALGLLWLGADLLVRGASALARRLGLSDLAIGLTVVAFGTSAPELIVSLLAALDGSSDIAVGNVVGSNICNIALILGLAALIRPAIVQAKVFRVDAPLLVVVSLTLTALLATGGVSRGAGVVLVAGLFAYVGMTVGLARRESETVSAEFEHAATSGSGRLGIDVLLVVAGLGALLAGGNVFVSAAVSLAEAIGVSQAVIGLTIVSVGTSLPELATSIVAASKGRGNIAVGNVVGSNLFNVLGILGITAVVRPLPMGNIGWPDLGVMSVLSIVLLPIVRTGFIVSRVEGALLFASYVAYVAWRIS